MQYFGFIWRAVLATTVFLAVGVLTDRVITAHALAHGMTEGSVRMAAATGGLFAGGAASCLTGIVLFLTRTREPEA